MYIDKIHSVSSTQETVTRAMVEDLYAWCFKVFVRHGAGRAGTWCYGMLTLPLSILLKEPFALKNSETVYFTSIFSTPSYSDIVPIDNFDLTFFYFYFVFEVFDTIQF